MDNFRFAKIPDYMIWPLDEGAVAFRNVVATED